MNGKVFFSDPQQYSFDYFDLYCKFKGGYIELIFSKDILGVCCN